MDTKKVSSPSKPQASSMAELLATSKSAFVSLKKSEIIKGTITKLTPGEILIDINAKTDALVLEKDKGILRQLLTLLSVGQEVTVSVLNPESDMGYPVVSLRRFLEDISWRKLEEFQKEQKPIQVTVTGTTRGGFLVTANGISGFLPQSQVAFSDKQHDLAGEKLDVFVLELNRPTRKIIFSQKKVLNAEEFQKATKNIKVGGKIAATVETITPFGIFASLSLADGMTLDGLVHISEISWDKVDTIEDIFTLGQPIETIIIGIDHQTKRIDLSIKRLLPDPFEKATEGFVPEQRVSGSVSKLIPGAVMVALQNGIEGMIRKEKIPPNVSFEIGDTINATIAQIDKKKHRIILIPVLKEKPIGYR